MPQENIDPKTKQQAQPNLQLGTSSAKRETIEKLCREFCVSIQKQFSGVGLPHQGIIQAYVDILSKHDEWIAFEILDQILKSWKPSSMLVRYPFPAEISEAADIYLASKAPDTLPAWKKEISKQDAKEIVDGLWNRQTNPKNAACERCSDFGMVTVAYMPTAPYVPNRSTRMTALDRDNWARNHFDPSNPKHNPEIYCAADLSRTQGLKKEVEIFSVRCSCLAGNNFVGPTIAEVMGSGMLGGSE